MHPNFIFIILYIMKMNWQKRKVKDNLRSNGICVIGAHRWLIKEEEIQRVKLRTVVALRRMIRLIVF